MYLISSIPQPPWFGLKLDNRKSKKCLPILSYLLLFIDLLAVEKELEDNSRENETIGMPREEMEGAFDLIATAYVVGFIQEGNGKIISFLRDKFFAPILAGWLLKRADFDCGKIL
ncbi:hypothetical protein FEM48_Zijuj09G0167100 [Ziziphus jujuba var. spinosa]|uniref:Uncharacterized protein n=1 Tax=Ziziphus jujuba var. spinosa TaxID=714518 RepID=A0A978UU45_ZIZJJ|nr:hypothetical protein FEM48_Zijuj09G0167100 [Ziziphus jujuba var. spinosa]